MKPLLETTHFVPWHECDLNAKMSIKSLSDILMQTAWEHAQMLGFGFEDLEKSKVLWVLSRFKIEIDAYPSWKDELRIQTWPTGTDKLFAIRHFRVFKNGKPIINAGSYWLIINQQSRRPVRPENFFKTDYQWIKEKAIGPIEKIAFNDELQTGKALPVQYSDLDYNGHVLNSKYTEHLINQIPLNKMKETEIKSYQVNFIKEARQSNSLIPKHNNSYTQFRICDESDKDLIHAQITRA